MKENFETKVSEVPGSETQDEIIQNTDTTPEENEIIIPVKYNKEIRNLGIKEAASLAQKGMKYEVIQKDYEQLKELAQKENKSVPKFLSDLNEMQIENRKRQLTEKCGGDSDFAEHILRLESENFNNSNGFDELKNLFPEIKTLEDLPQKVLENSKIKGTLLLDEFLRYRALQEKREKSLKKSQEKAENLSIGSQINKVGSISPETEQFLKGLWK
ncbi:MAG: hypothetical protein IJD55_01230 [Clostridia bacterium]|nr:hypothetical protein [Clostridia bacterium]